MLLARDYRLCNKAKEGRGAKAGRQAGGRLCVCHAFFTSLPWKACGWSTRLPGLISWEKTMKALQRKHGLNFGSCDGDEPSLEAQPRSGNSPY